MKKIALSVFVFCLVLCLNEVYAQAIQRPLQIINNKDCDLLVNVFAYCPDNGCGVREGSVHLLVPANTTINYTVSDIIPWTEQPTGSCQWEWEVAQGSQTCLNTIGSNICRYDEATIGLTSCGHKASDCFEFSTECGCAQGTIVYASFATYLTPFIHTVIAFN